MNINFNWQDWATYVAAAGLFGLSLYQVTQGDWTHAAQSFLAALAALGIGKNVNDTRATLRQMQGKQ